MKKEYYTPQIEEFHVGFEYETKSNFQDGRVKTQKDFDEADWEKRICDSALMYIERALHGKNAENGLCGIRVKYLDEKEIQGFGFSSLDILAPKAKYKVNLFQSTLENNRNQKIAIIYNFSAKWCLIFTHNYDLILQGDDSHFRSNSTLFCGTIKNKSELKKVLNQIKYGNTRN